jgi:lipoprotein LpqH
MNRGLVLAVGGAAIVVAGLSGCSSSSGGGTGSTTSGDVTVTLDGQPQTVKGNVSCATQGGNVVIGIGDGTAGIGATLTSGDSPEVQAVGMGSSNGIALAYTKGGVGGEAKATKDGSKYDISGKVTGIDIKNPMAPVTKPFEIKVTCP